jgi:hypothetical protein
MEYPNFSLHIANEDLIEHFSLTPDERYLLSRWRKDANTLGFTVLLKAFQFLGYPPRQKEHIPGAIISCISRQLKLDAILGIFDQRRKKSNRDRHDSSFLAPASHDRSLSRKLRVSST